MLILQLKSEENETVEEFIELKFIIIIIIIII